MKKVLTLILLNLVMGVIGFFGGSMIGRVFARAQSQSLLLILFLCLLAFCVQLVIHEAGHVIFGWITGYRPLSFRIFNLMWQKVDGKWRFSFYSIPGTLGQALMSPPDLVNDRLPYLLYHLGGCLANLLSIPLLLGVNILIPLDFWGILATVGLVLAFINLVPVFSPFPNDGVNAWLLYRYPQAQVYFWASLKINQAMTQGVLVRDMPATYFPKPVSADLAHSFGQHAAAIYGAYLFEKGEIDAALAYLRSLDVTSSKWSELFRLLVKATIGYIELLTNQELTQTFSKKEWQLLCALAKSQPSLAVFCYAYYRFVERNDQKAEAVLKQFEKMRKHPPYPKDYRQEQDRLLQLSTK